MASIAKRQIVDIPQMAREAQDALHETPGNRNVQSKSAGRDGEQKLYDADYRMTQVEPMDAECPKEDAQQAGDHLVP